MNTSVLKTLRIMTTVLVGLAILFAFFVSAIKIFGFQIYGVLTGSMEPSYPRGSLLYIREVDPDALRIGDVITFSVSPNVMATHRIVDIVADEQTPTYYRFQTKGDANQSVDTALVEPRKIVGKVSFAIPVIGYVAHYVQEPPGLYVAILVSLVLIILVILTDHGTNQKWRKLRETKSFDTSPTVLNEPCRMSMPANHHMQQVNPVWPQQTLHAVPSPAYVQHHSGVPPIQQATVCVNREPTPPVNVAVFPAGQYNPAMRYPAQPQRVARGNPETIPLASVHRPNVYPTPVVKPISYEQALQTAKYSSANGEHRRRRSTMSV
ncbi:MAG: signal peptidase I [Clostridia bacterium]|nr:signal peptidase I [Clostridia bacterium]